MSRALQLGFSVSLLGLGLVAACTVSVTPQPDEPGKFPCTTDDDCLAPLVCSASGDAGSTGGGGDAAAATGVCVEQQTDEQECVDEDGDGFGVGDNRSQCDACQNPGDYWFCEGAECCAEDCNDDPNDGGAAQMPHFPELCDGQPNNCTPPPGQAPECSDGTCTIETDDGQSTFTCTDADGDGTPRCDDEPAECVDGNCPLRNAEDADQLPENTTFSCRDIDGDGNGECVREGNNIQGKPKCVEKEGLGICRDGEWSEVDSDCKG